MKQSCAFQTLSINHVFEVVYDDICRSYFVQSKVYKCHVFSLDKLRLQIWRKKQHLIRGLVIHI